MAFDTQSRETRFPWESTRFPWVHDYTLSLLMLILRPGRASARILQHGTLRGAISFSVWPWAFIEAAFGVQLARCMCLERRFYSMTADRVHVMLAVWSIFWAGIAIAGVYWILSSHVVARVMSIGLEVPERFVVLCMYVFGSAALLWSLLSVVILLAPSLYTVALALPLWGITLCCECAILSACSDDSGRPCALAPRDVLMLVLSQAGLFFVLCAATFLTRGFMNILSPV